MTSHYKTWSLGRSVQHRPLEALAVSAKRPDLSIPDAPAQTMLPWVLFLGAVHGDESEGAWLMAEARAQWLKGFPFRNVGAVIFEQVNPDGLALMQRGNGHGVDLNRNLPTRDWSPEASKPRYFPGATPGSEPENRALMRLIDQIKPIAILSAHSFSQYQINLNGPSRAWGERLAQVCNYPVTEDIGYPTPGCFGTYAGHEKGIPTITLEIEYGISRERVIEVHMPVLNAALAYWENLHQAV